MNKLKLARKIAKKEAEMKANFVRLLAEDVGRMAGNRGYVAPEGLQAYDDRCVLYIIDVIEEYERKKARKIERLKRKHGA